MPNSQICVLRRRERLLYKVLTRRRPKTTVTRAGTLFVAAACHRRKACAHHARNEIAEERKQQPVSIAAHMVRVEKGWPAILKRAAPLCRRTEHWKRVPDIDMGHRIMQCAECRYHRTAKTQQ